MVCFISSNINISFFSVIKFFFGRFVFNLTNVQSRKPFDSTAVTAEPASLPTVAEAAKGSAWVTEDL